MCVTRKILKTKIPNPAFGLESPGADIFREMAKYLYITIFGLYTFYSRSILDRFHKT